MINGVCVRQLLARKQCVVCDHDRCSRLCAATMMIPPISSLVEMETTHAHGLCIVCVCECSLRIMLYGILQFTIHTRCHIEHTIHLHICTSSDIDYRNLLWPGVYRFTQYIAGCSHCTCAIYVLQFVYLRSRLVSRKCFAIVLAWKQVTHKQWITFTYPRRLFGKLWAN